MNGSTAGYSGSPLTRKLGIKAGWHVVSLEAPAGYAKTLQPLPEGVSIAEECTSETDLVQVFCAWRHELAACLPALRAALRPDAVLWVSWPKKAAKRPGDLTEDGIRELALPLGFVDVKVCAVDEVWSGLKLVVRKALR